MALDPSYFFYSEGTISLTNGSDIATGNFTAWDPAVLRYDFVFPGDGTAGMSVVQDVLAMDQIKLAKPWTGPTLTNVPYFIVRWVRHTDPRVYGVRVSEYLTRLKGIPENIEEVAQEIHADRQAVEAAMTTVVAIETAVDADRQAAQTAAGTAQGAATTATEQAGIAQQWADSASSGVLPNNGVSNAKLADMPANTFKGRATAGAGDPEDLTVEQVNALLGTAHGGILVSVQSATVLAIKPYGAGRLIINGASRPVVATTIPSTAVPAATSATDPNVQFIYAYWTGSAIAYEVSTTQHATHTNGVEIKAGDPTRTLVAAVWRDPANGFQDTAFARNLANWFNRRGKNLYVSYNGAGVATPTTTALTGELSAITWAGDTFYFEGSAVTYANVAQKICVLSAMIDGGLPTLTPGTESNPDAGAVEGYYVNATVSYYGTTVGYSFKRYSSTGRRRAAASGRCNENLVYTASFIGGHRSEVFI
jgi:hypothetical protein